MNLLSNIFGVARYERIMLMRTTRFRALGLAGVVIPLGIGLALAIPESMGATEGRFAALGLSGFIPFYVYTYIQTVMIGA